MTEGAIEYSINCSDRRVQGRRGHGGARGVDCTSVAMKSAVHPCTSHPCRAAKVTVMQVLLRCKTWCVSAESATIARLEQERIAPEVLLPDDVGLPDTHLHPAVHLQGGGDSCDDGEDDEPYHQVVDLVHRPRDVV